ncbi:MAG TPA: sulfite exporter TauE/SafE family protein [Phycisphaerae bacterium]|nr:sulfite exporter TauE/SafE family protein [Phycisphaerae bacterium]
MVAVALLAFVLPDLRGTVAVLMVLTCLTEVSVLSRNWRRAQPRLLVLLIVPMGVGLWIGTRILVSGDVSLLKRMLGVVIAAAGAWFLYSERHRSAGDPSPDPPHALARTTQRVRNLLAVPVGLVSGVLGGMFGTGGPPVIILLRSYRLDKAAFRATLLAFFFTMTLIRAPLYWRNGTLTTQVLLAAIWLAPGAAAGTAAGMLAHRRLSERKFAVAVAVLLILLGILLLAGRGK